jgi:xanthine dehydrogenase accessory factor
MSVLTLKDIALTLERGGVFVVVIDVEGSTPALPGAKMAVLPDGSAFGTVGGGVLETTAIEEALRRFASKETGIVEYQMGKDGALGAECGGKANIYFEPIYPKAKLWLFGAGHVGREIAKVARTAGWFVVACDDRPGAAEPENIQADEYRTGEYSEMASKAQIGREDCVAIVTAGHRGDEVVLKNILSNEIVPVYVGMMGSKYKIAEVFSHLRETGIAEELISGVHAPIGLNVGTVEPGEIAVAVVAEMLAVKNHVERISKCSQ